MSDNVTLNIGTGGDNIAADDISGIKWQRVKLAFGSDGVANEVADSSGKRVPVNLSESALLPAALGDNGGLKVEDVAGGVTVVLQAAQVSAVVDGTTTRTTVTGLENYHLAAILIDITAGGSATGTLQLFLQDSVDGGTKWNDLISSNTFAFGSSITTQLFSINDRLATSHVQGSQLLQETLEAGSARSGPFGDRIRVREKVSGTSGTPTGVTYTITAVFKK